MKEILSKSKEKAAKFHAEFKKQTATAIIAAFGLVIALSWQTVIKKIVDSFPKSGILLSYPYLAEIYSAVIVTIIAIIGIALIGRWAQNTSSNSS